MSDPIVFARKEGRAGRLTLNRPKALHALNIDMCRTMTTALLGWRDDPEVELVVIDHAEGTRGFCAGGDVLMLAAGDPRAAEMAREFFAVEYRLNTLIKEYPKPYIALIDGIVMGGGVGISVHGSHRVVTERTVFAMPESGIGLAPDVGGGYFLPRLAGELGAWLGLTGARLKGADVLAAGVGTHSVDSADLSGLTESLCQDGIVALSDLPSSADLSVAPLLAEIGSAFSGSSVEEIMTRLADGSDWAKDQATLLLTKSPLTLKVALRQIRAGAEMTFREVMAMEYRICTRMTQTENFREGVRAVLVDRDNAPQWQPPTLAHVTDEMVAEFFAPLGDHELDFGELAS